MCGSVKFKHEGKVLTVYFPNPKAVLPVALKHGGLELVTWGRRKGEPGKLPAGGWARLKYLIQHVRHQPVGQLGLEPGGLGRHHLTGVGHRHHVGDGSRKQ